VPGSWQPAPLTSPSICAYKYFHIYICAWVNFLKASLWERKNKHFPSNNKHFAAPFIACCREEWFQKSHFIVAKTIFQGGLWNSRVIPGSSCQRAWPGPLASVVWLVCWPRHHWAPAGYSVSTVLPCGMQYQCILVLEPIMTPFARLLVWEPELSLELSLQ
jgi:hypothetical protein